LLTEAIELFDKVFELNESLVKENMPPISNA